MSEHALKPGWHWVKFGDVVRLNTERCADPVTAGIERYVGLDHIEPEDLRIRRWGQVADGTTFTNRFRPGQVLFGKRRAYQRKVAVADFDGVCSGDIYIFESQDSAVLLPELLPFICQTEGFFEHAVGTSAGSLSPRTNWTQLAQYEFALPPVEEQRRIIELLIATENVCASTQDALEAAQSIPEIVSATRYAGVLTGNMDSNVSIGDLFIQVNDKGFSGLPILSVTIDGTVVRRASLERHVSDETGDEKYIRVMPEDLAYNTMRLWQGAIGIVYEEGLISPAYTVLRLVDKRYPISFFYDLFRSALMRREYRRFVKGVASDRWRLYFRDLATIMLNVPPPDRANELASQFRNFTLSINLVAGRYTLAREFSKNLIAATLGDQDGIYGIEHD